MAGSPGFEPGIYGLEAGNLYNVDWTEFEAWLRQSHKPRVASTIVLIMQCDMRAVCLSEI